MGTERTEPLHYTYVENKALMVLVKTEYISVGGNRHPAASDWNEHSGLLAFGAGNNIALWDSAVCRSLAASE